MGRIKNQSASARYSTKRGVINLQFDDTPPKTMEAQKDVHIIGVILVQKYDLKKGIELFGEKSDSAIVKELTQIHELETYEPILASDLSWEEKNKSLESLLFIIEKRNGYIKVRKVSDGSKHHMYDGYEKADGSSPMVATDSSFFTGVLDACEGREVAVPGTLLTG